MEAFCVLCDGRAECSYRTIVSKVVRQKCSFSMILVLCTEDPAMQRFPNPREHECMNVHIQT
jgi:hypothetical protein